MYNGYVFPKRTIKDVIRYNAISYSHDPDEAWASYLMRNPDACEDCGNTKLCDCQGEDNE